MEDKQAEIIYRKVYDKRQKKFGIKVTGRKEWYVEPQFDALGFVELSSSIDGEVWFKENGRYGWYSIPKKTVCVFHDSIQQFVLQLVRLLVRGSL